MRLLSILGGKFVSDAVEQLDVALLGILFQGVYKGPGHGPSGLGGDGGIGSESSSLARAQRQHRDEALDIGLLTKFGHLYCPTT